MAAGLALFIPSPKCFAFLPLQLHLIDYITLLNTLGRQRRRAKCRHRKGKKDGFHQAQNTRKRGEQSGKRKNNMTKMREVSNALRKTNGEN